MDAHYIIATYVLIDDTLKVMNVRDHHHATVSTAEILTVAVIAAKYFQNHHERALVILQMTGYLPRLSISRFNRRLHQAAHQLIDLLDCLRAHYIRPAHFAADTMPLPACKRFRADHCKLIPQLPGYLGRCAAKNEWFCGWRLHWLCDRHGFPIAFDLVPAVWHELTTLQNLLADLPPGSTVFADGAYISAEHEALALLHGITLVPQFHQQMLRHNSPAQVAALRRYRNAIETAHSLLEKMGVQRLHAVTQSGFGLKVHASLLALAVNALIDQTLIY